MKTSILLLLFSTLFAQVNFAQTDKDKLALAINTADESNMKQLQQFIWKRKSVVSIDGQVKLTTLTEFSFNDQGELETRLIDAESTVKQKRGLRGKIQENAAEDKAEYWQKALELSLAYTFMTKGELLDFFSKATLTEKDGIIEATGENVRVKGDKLTLLLDGKTNLYIKKTFSTFLGKDVLSGEINYEKFSSGINHGTTTVLNMPAQKMKIDAINQDYTQRIK